MHVMADRIRQARRLKTLSQTQLAEQVGVQRSAVAQWERVGGTHPSVEHLAQIAVITQVLFEWLATGRGAMTLSREVELDSIATAEAILVEDPLEFRLVRAFREAPLKARLSLLEVMETLALQRTGRPRTRGPGRPGGDARGG